MPVKRITDINIQQRGLFTAIYGNVNEDEFFVDDDLRKYSLWQQLYLYLKEQGYEMVLFYDTTNNFHSYGQNDLMNFLRIDPDSKESTTKIEANRYEARHIASPLRHSRIRSGTERKNVSANAEDPLHRSIQLYKQLGTSNNFWRTTINRNLLEYFTHVMPEARRTAIIIKYPDNSHFENAEKYLTLFKETNAVYNLIESQNKIIVVYGCANSNALIENLNRSNSNLFVADYFKSIFLNTETDSYRVKAGTTFQITLPEHTEIKNWLNRKRLSNNIRLFNSVPLNKIVLRFVQERKRLTDLENYNLQQFIDEINNKSGWDRLNEMMGLDAVKLKVRDIVDDLKAIRENNLPMTYRPHLCFIGNPGTGKTTVASIVAEIFKEEDIVPIGHYTYTKATELMGQYVGEAQNLVKRKCEEATGGVLFIDEAYAFVDEGTKTFGDSAVTELIAWLEDKKWQKETIVILAGYPDEIEGLFKKSNKGLRGRFTDDHYLAFENYNADQLFQILVLNANKNGISISDDAAAQLRKIFGRLLKDNSKNMHWDNARRVENILKILYSNSRKRGSGIILIEDIPESMRSMIGEKAIADVRNTQEFMQLQDLIGLDSVKQTITDLIESIEFEQYQLDNGLAKEKTIQPLHLVFTGPPGTGKTTVARLFGALLKNLGILSGGHVIEANRKDLVADYVGQTATKTNEVIQKAMGGILFIDEAYTLSYGGHNDFGREAIDTLLPIMENDRDKFVVIAAGYETNMNQFLNSNPGLNDRFNQRILFPSLSETELLQVYNLFCQNSGLLFNVEHNCVLIQYFSILKERDGEKFSNSRTVRKLFEETSKQQKKRLNRERKEGELTEDKMRLVILGDVKDAINVLNPDTLQRIDFNCISVKTTIDVSGLDTGVVEFHIASDKEIHISTVSNNAKSDPTHAVGLIKANSNRGTGFLISNDGYFVTANHVVNGLKSCSFYSSVTQKEHNASILWQDAAIDIAIGKISETDEKLVPLSLNSDSAEPKMQEEVLLVGYPMGGVLGDRPYISPSTICNYEPSLTLSEIHKFDAIATYANATEGYSGGPLIRKADNIVIGVLHGGLPDKGNINFASDIRQIFGVNGLKLEVFHAPTPISSIRNVPTELPAINTTDDTNTVGLPKDGIPDGVSDAIGQLLFDYCIIDTNIWMPEDKDFRKHNHNGIRVLMNIYKYFGKKLIAHGKTYEELQRIKDNKKGVYTKEVSIAAAEGFRVLTLGNEDNLIDIPELKGEHEERAYADLAIYEYTHKKYKEGKSICLVSNDKDCRVRVRSILNDNKSSIAFRFLKANELKKIADVIFYTEWYKSKFPRK